MARRLACHLFEPACDRPHLKNLLVFVLAIAAAACGGREGSGRTPRAGAGGATAAGSAGTGGAGASAGTNAAGRGGSAAPRAGRDGTGAGGAGAGSAGAAGTVAAGSGGVAGSAAGSGGGAAPTTWWKPGPGTSWQWQLTGRLDTSVEVDVYDIDLFDTTKATIDTLHADGRKVICYMDTAFEPDRPDSDALEPFRGNPIDGWPGQYWLDVREPKVLEVMKARLAMAAAKGCDGIEADDVDARSNEPGFPISAAQQQAFIRGIAEESHRLGMAFGLKNDLEEIGALIDVSDFAVNEECFEYDECRALTPFISAGKAVFHVEYSEDDLEGKADEICQRANALNFDTLIKKLDLDAERIACRSR